MCDSEHFYGMTTSETRSIIVSFSLSLPTHSIIFDLVVDFLHLNRDSNQIPPLQTQQGGEVAILSFRSNLSQWLVLDLCLSLCRSSVLLQRSSIKG